MNLSNSRLPGALAAVTLWSTNAYAAELALDRMSVGWLLTVQYGAATTVLLAVGSVHRPRGSSGTPKARTILSEVGQLGPTALVVGVVGLTGTTFLQYVAFATAPIVAANVLAYGWPLLAAIWIAATRRSRHALLSACFAVLGFGGVALIFTSPSRAADAGGGSDVTLGYLAALGSATCMAVYTIAAGRVTAHPSALLVPATVVGAALATMLTVASASDPPSAAGALAAAYIGVGPMAAGYALWTHAMAGGGAERLAPLGYATPLLSTVILLFAGAPSTAGTLTGVGLVLGCSLGVLALERQVSPGAKQSARPAHQRDG